MKSYEAIVTIAATPEQVWALLTDGAGIAQWDSDVVRVQGEIAPGETIRVVSTANPGRTFPVRVTVFEPGRRMVWSGGMPLGLFRGVRTFTLTQSADSTTTFTTREEYTGPLLPLM